MKCPMCRSEDIRTVYATVEEPHGEVFDEEFLQCNACGALFNENDLVQEPEELKAHPTEPQQAGRA